LRIEPHPFIPSPRREGAKSRKKNENITWYQPGSFKSLSSRRGIAEKNKNTSSFNRVRFFKIEGFEHH